jgi:hypothetical protein
MHSVPAFPASFIILFVTILIFLGLFLGLLVAAGRLLEVVLGRELDDVWVRDHTHWRRRP